MARTRAFAVIALVATLAIVASACGSDKKDEAKTNASTTTTAPKSNDRGNVDGQLVLGALLPQSGDLSAIIKSLLTPIQMAVTEINDAGGVNGKDVLIKQADDGTSVDVASSSLDTLLTSDKVDAILGAASSTTTLGIIDKIKTNGVVECSGSNTSAELSVDGGAAGGYYLRTAPSDNLQGPALGAAHPQRQQVEGRILTRNDSYGTGFGKSLEAALKDGGADVIANAAYDPKASDFKSDVAKVAGKGADAIVVLGFNDDGGKVIKEMIAQNLGPKDVQIYTADGMQGSSFYKGVDESNPAVIEGIKGTAPAAAPSGVTHPFAAAFAKTSVDTIFSAVLLRLHDPRGARGAGRGFGRPGEDQGRDHRGQ